MWNDLKGVLRPDQLFNMLAVGLLAECVLLVPLVVNHVLVFDEVIDFIQRPAGVALAFLGAVNLSRVISSTVGLVTLSTAWPIWDRSSRGWSRLSAAGRYVIRLMTSTYRRTFFGVSSRSSARKDVVEEMLFRNGDAFGTWARKSITDELGLDLELLKNDDYAKENLLWVLYISGKQVSVAKPIRDDVEGFDLAANFQARLAIVLHVGFWVHVSLVMSGAGNWALLSALVFAFLTRLLGASITGFLQTKHRLTILRFLAVRTVAQER